MPRVLHVIRDLAPGGAATQCRLLVEHGEPAGVASLKRPPTGSTADWLQARFRHDPVAVRNLLRVVRRKEPEVLQSWDEPSARLCRRASWWAGVPWAHTVREPAGEGSVAVRADLLLAADEALAQRLRGLGGEPAVVRNAYDPRFAVDALPLRGGARERLRRSGVDVRDEAPVVLVVARLDDAAAAKELAWAADLVRVVRPGLRLLVAGSGTAWLAAQRFAARACERGLVTWLGDWPELPTLYAAADVVWCGRGGGAAPTPAVEAMAAGKPVVVADAPGRDLLVPTEADRPPTRVRWDDRAGWARSAKRLLENGELARQLGTENAARVAATHSAESVAAAHRDAVARLLATR